MASVRSKQASPFGSIIESTIGGGSSTLNFVDFLESPFGPKFRLYPVQYLLAKVLFGVPLDYKETKIPVWDKFRENLIAELPEREWLKYMFDHGKTHVEDWRDLKADGYSEQELICGRRGGKAMDLDTPVPTPTGFKRMGDMQVGDTVFGPDGKPTKVLQAHEPFEDQVYRVTFDDGTSAVCHGGHLWHTFTKLERKNLTRRRPRATQSTSQNPWAFADKDVVGEVRTTEEIRDTLLYGRAGGKPETNHAVRIASGPVELPSRELPLDAYWLGLWLGDGNKDRTAITTMDEEIRDHCYRVAQDLGLRVKVSSNGSRALTYALSGPNGSPKGQWGMKPDHNPLRVLLRDLGVWENKHVPDMYLWASTEQRLALLQGLMDTDGGCHRSRCEFDSTNERLSRGVYHLAASLGLKPFWGEKRATLYGKDCGACYRVSWTGTLPVFRLPRKLKQLPTEVKGSQGYRFITAVEPVDRRTVRCITVDRPDGLFLFGHNFNVTHNSQYVSACADYMLYKLLAIRDPQDYYQLTPGSTIDFTILATDEDGAGRLYGKIRNDVNNSEFFRPYLHGVPGVDEMKFITEADRGRRNVIPSITVASLPCTTRAVRGPSSIFLVLDEFAFFRNALGARSDEVYDSAKPATALFVSPEGKRDAKVVTITSPWTRVGMVYDLHNSAMKAGASSSVFSIRLASAEMNHRMDSSFLKEEYDRKPATWAAEYGGEFIDSAGSLVPPDKIDECVDKGRLNVTGFDPRMVGRDFFWGLDLGLKKDATALAVCHWEVDERQRPLLIYDYIGRMIVGDEQHKNVDQLSVDEILDWFEEVNKWLPGSFGCTDQYAGASFITLAKLRGIDFIDLVHLTGGINSQMYFALQGYLNQRICRFPDYKPFIHELKNVETFYVGKSQIKVEAPNEKDAHDDMCDAVALAAWRAQKWMMETGAKGFAFTGSSALLGADNLKPGQTGQLDVNVHSMADIRVALRHRSTEMNRAFGGVRAGRGGLTRRG